MAYLDSDRDNPDGRQSVPSVMGAAQFEHFTVVWYQVERRARQGPATPPRTHADAR